MLTANLALSKRSAIGAAPSPEPVAARRATRALELTVYDNLEAVAGAWRAFQQLADCTAFQNYEWLSTWQRRIGADLLP